MSSPIRTNILTCLSDISTWVSSQQLKLNSAKTELLIFYHTSPPCYFLSRSLWTTLPFYLPFRPITWPSLLTWTSLLIITPRLCLNLANSFCITSVRHGLFYPSTQLRFFLKLSIHLIMATSFSLAWINAISPYSHPVRMLLQRSFC